MIFHLFTLAFVILKLTGVIAWSWFWVVSPSIAIVTITFGTIALAALTTLALALKK